MWLIVAFDLPTETPKNKTDYRRFRDFLLADGHTMLQYSVYARPCANREDAEKHSDRIESALPPDGKVRVLALTGMQYARMKCFFGKSTEEAEKPPEQLSFF